MQLHGVILSNPEVQAQHLRMRKSLNLIPWLSQSPWNFMVPPTAVLTLCVQGTSRALSTSMFVLVPYPFLPPSGSSILRNCPSSFQCISRRAAEYRIPTSRTVWTGSTKQLLEQLFPRMSELTPRGAASCILGWKHKLALMLWSYHGLQEEASQEETSLGCGTGLQPVNPGKAASGASKFKACLGYRRRRSRMKLLKPLQLLMLKPALALPPVLTTGV